MVCCAVWLLAAVEPRAAPVFVDFGSAAPSTGTKANNLTSSALNTSLTGLKDSNGVTTGISLSITDNFHTLSNFNNGYTTVAGAAATAGFTGAMARDYFLLNNDPLTPGGETSPSAGIRFSGLTTGQSYTLTILSSRNDPTGPRLLDVTLTGETSVSGSIDGTNNNSAVLELTTTATAGGTLDCSFAAHVGSIYAHVNALKLTPPTLANEIPGARFITWAGAPRVGGMVTGDYSYLDTNGDAESGTTRRWERASDAAGTDAQIISGANSTTYVLQAADAGKYLRYVVTPGAATGATPGLASPSDWHGPVVTAGAFGSFHIGNSFTRWGHIPLQLVNLAAATGGAHAGHGQLNDEQGLQYQWENRLATSDVQEGGPSAPELATGTWDTVVLQPQSREWQPASLGTFTTYAQNFYNLANASGTGVYLYAYWPYLSESPSLQTSIDAAFEQVRASISTGTVPARVIPVGAAFKAVSDAITAGTITGITRPDLYQDEIHPSTLGYYLSSLVHYATLRQQSPVGLPAQGINADPLLNNTISIDPTLAGKFQVIAWDTARRLGTSGVTAGRFATWAKNLPPGQQGVADIPFADGTPNLTRYAFGLSTTGADPGIGRLPACVTAAEGQIAMEYRLGADAEDAGVLTIPEWSGDLVTWTQPPPTGLITTRTGELVHLEFPVSGSQVFLRVRVAMP